MEQKDYLMKEIEKIGILFRALLGTLITKKEDFSLTTESHLEMTKEILLSEMGFDLDRFLSLDEESSGSYLLQFKGINGENKELLAEIISHFGRNMQSQSKRLFLEKALQLYIICEKTDKTFSFNRKTRIKEIKNEL
jgi:hypothetical protein